VWLVVLWTIRPSCSLGHCIGVESDSSHYDDVRSDRIGNDRRLCRTSLSVDESTSLAGAARRPLRGPEMEITSDHDSERIRGAFSCAGCLHAACAGARMAWRPWQANALNAPSA